jgi:hypothetical protein
MGPEEKLVGGVVEQSECWGFKGRQFVFGGVWPRVCGPLFASTVQPAIRVRLSLARLTLCFYASMVEASERTQSTNECLPKGEVGRAPLTKAV